MGIPGFEIHVTGLVAVTLLGFSLVGSLTVAFAGYPIAAPVPSAGEGSAALRPPRNDTRETAAASPELTAAA